MYPCLISLYNRHLPPKGSKESADKGQRNVTVHTHNADRNIGSLSGWHTRLFLDGMPAVVMLNLAHLGHRTPSTVSCILPVTSSVQLRARPIRSRPGLASTNHRPASFKRTGRAVGSPPVSYICNVRSWAAATNCELRMIPTSRTNSLTISFWV